MGEALAPISYAADLLETIPGISLLETIPGISDVVAHVIVAEIGADMSRFPTAGHLVSWAGPCPRNDESAGKRRSTRVRKSGTWFKTTLATAARAAARKKHCCLRSQFLRIKSRRGPKKATLAVAASMLTAAYYMLRDGVEYRDPGHDYFDRLDKTKAISRLVRRLGQLGCEEEMKRRSSMPREASQWQPAGIFCPFSAPRIAFRTPARSLPAPTAALHAAAALA